MEPDIDKYPTELFGYPYTLNSNEVKKKRGQQFCPFLGGECKKPRKSEPSIKVGICSVGYKGFAHDFLPVVICPFRFVTKQVFDTIEKNYFGKISNNNLWISEVSLGVGGSVDYVVVKTNDNANIEHIDDFVCVEFQAAGTTGTPWEAVKEHRKNGLFKSKKYGYGINWANEFAKTMMQQAYKKGVIIESWNKKIIFAIQDVGLEYLKNRYDTSGLRESNDKDPIHFYTYKMQWVDKDDQWCLIFDNKYSANTEGIRKMLAGAPSSMFPSIDEFHDNIRKKYKKASTNKDNKYFTN